MDLEQLKYFTEQIAKLPIHKQSKTYYRDQTRWIDFETRLEASVELKNAVSRASSLSKPIKIKSLNSVAFSPDNDSLMVVANISTRSREDTLEAHLNRLKECLDNATRAYHAHHDELTGVLNRHGIKHALQQTNFTETESDDGTDKEEQQVSNNADIVVFAFDIDRFKSVNDTYGHEAGDIVLASFANRIKGLLPILEEKYSATFIFGRPGGEEFELIGIGALSRMERTTISNFLLDEIRKPLDERKTQALPPQSKSGGPIETPQFPSVVTSSIGIASKKATAKAESVITIHSILRKEADAALYRAKADGRNCAREYEDILRKHGRILEHCPQSELVQIDIGSNVGVERGQVYAVYFPPFTGTEKMQDRDKGSKILGDYPRISSAKIKVIHVQKELASAVIVERSSNSIFPQGSHLEYIYTGSTLVPCGRDANLTALTEPISALYPCIDQLMACDNLGLVATLRGRLAKNDTRAREASLSELYTLLRMYLPSKSRIFHSMAGEPFVVVPASEINTLDATKNIFNTVKSKVKQAGFEVIVGVCHLNSLPEQATRVPASLAFYAKAALNTVIAMEDEAAIFNQRTPNKLLHRWRNKRAINDALVDYQHFHLFGFDAPSLDNQLALGILESDATEFLSLAEALLDKAASAEHSEDVFRANLAIIYTRQEKYNEAYQIFKGIEAYTLEQSIIYALAYARCALSVFDDGDTLTRSEVSTLLTGAIERFNKPPAPPFDKWWKEIKSTLKSGRFD